MRYEQPLYRPPSEANSLILQATIGCSWNHCTYCGMYRNKRFRIRPLDDLLDELRDAAKHAGGQVRTLFVADGDALVMPAQTWVPLLREARSLFPKLRRISCYATAQNVLEKSAEELETLKAEGLDLLYIGPESGDDVTLKAIAKGATFDDFVQAAGQIRQAGLRQSLIVLLGAGGAARSAEHAHKTAELITAMDPTFFSALTLMVVPGTPTDKLQRQGKFELPDEAGLLGELRVIVEESSPTDAMFRTNHASNYLALGGRLPRDREAIVKTIDEALAGRVRLRREGMRGL